MFKVVVPPYTDKHPPITAPISVPAPTKTATEGLLAKAVSSIDTLTHPLQPSLVPVHPEPITPASFAPFGQIIQAYPDPSTQAEGMIVQGNPAAKVEKYCRLADVVNTYPEGEGAYTGIGVYRATKKVGLERGKVFDVRLMERHMYTSQAFIPMSKGEVSHRPFFSHS